MADEPMREERSEFVEHMREARRSFRKQWASLVPSEFWQYRRKARQEFLLALRSAVDAAIDHLESDEDAAPAGRTKTKVEVEID